MKRLAVYLKPYWLYAVLAPLFMLFEVALEIQQPRLMGDIVDIGIAGGDIRYVLVTGAKMLSIAVLMSLGGIGCVYFSAKASQYFGTDLRNALYEKIHSLAYFDIDLFKSASLVTRLTNDVTQVQHLVLIGLRMMSRSPFISIGAFIMAMRLNVKMSLIIACALPAMSVLIVVLIRKSFPLFKTVQEKLDRVNTVMRENLSGVRVVKAFVRSDYEEKRFQAANGELTDTGIRAGNILALSMPLMTVFMNLILVAILWLGGYLTGRGEMEAGKVIAFINYATQIMFSFMMLAFVFISVSRAQASAERVNEILDAESSMTGPENGLTPQKPLGKIEFRDVWFRYSPSSRDYDLKGVSLTVSPGEKVAVLGETGSGKSTLVSLIPRLYDVSRGSILIDGIDVKDFDLPALRAMVGVVPQETILFSGTVEENIRWGKADASEEEIKAAASASQAEEFLSALPEGYGAKVGQRGVGLSGGQRQRVSIARAMVKKPLILLLDDSTSAVDVMTEIDIQRALRAHYAGCTCIIIAQRINAALDCDRILVMKNGEIAEQGTHEELIALGGIYLDIYKSQLGEEGLPQTSA